MKAASGRQIDRAGKFPFQKLGRITSPVRVRNKHRIDRMVDALMKKNKLTGGEMEALLKE